jgi:hypothetical protein
MLQLKIGILILKSVGFVIHFKELIFQCSCIGQVRVQAIRGLPLFCKDTPEHIAKIVDILVQLLASGKLCVFFFFFWVALHIL